MNCGCSNKISFPGEQFKDCCEVILSNCIPYTGDIGCLMGIPTFPSINDVIEAIITKQCTATNITSACLTSKGYNVTDLSSFVGAVSDAICQVLGCQTLTQGNTQGTITSLCAINNRLNSLSVISCFQPIASLAATATLEQLIAAIQTSLCTLINATPPVDKYVRCSATDTTSGYLIQKLQNGNTVLFSTQNAGGNENLKAEVKIDPASTLPWSASAAGLKLDCCPVPQVDAAINCAGITVAGVIDPASAIAGVTIAVPYNDTIGGYYPAIVIPSNETVAGTPVATAAAVAGTFVPGGGTIVFNVTGNTTGFSGSSISFDIIVNGSTCSVTIPLVAQTTFTVDCVNVLLLADPMQVGTPVSNSTTGHPYLKLLIDVTTLGYPSGINIASQVVDGLTFGGFASYSLSLGVNTIYIPVSGTPTATNIAVPVSINGTVECTINLTASVPQPPSYYLECVGCQGFAGTLSSIHEGDTVNINITLCYINGVNGSVPGFTVAGVYKGTGAASGLTLTVPTYNVTTATGSITATITGTVTGTGTIIFNILHAEGCLLQLPVLSNGNNTTLDIQVTPQLSILNDGRTTTTITISTTTTDGKLIVWDWDIFNSLASLTDPNYKPGPHLGAYQYLEYRNALLANKQIFHFHADQVPMPYETYLQRAHFDFYDNTGTLIPGGGTDVIFPGTIGTPGITVVQFYNFSGAFPLHGNIYYSDMDGDVTIPAGTVKIIASLFIGY